MDELREYIELRVKTLRDDADYWNDKYLSRPLGDEGRYELEQIKIKQAVVGELLMVLARTDKTEPGGRR